MAHEVVTLLDIAKRNNSDAVVGLIDDAVASYPEWRLAPARAIPGTSYKTLVRTALPAAGFRAANEGIENKKGAYVNKLVECFILDASWDLDKAVADAAIDGAAAECALQAADHMEGAIKSVCSQFYYGAASTAVNPDKGFQGLVNFVDSSMVVDATETGSTTTSVWAVRWGLKDVYFPFGMNGALEEGELMTFQATDTAGKKLWKYGQSLQGWIGLQVGSIYSVGRIKNISASTSSKTLDDDMIASLIAKFPVGKLPNVLLMSRRSLRQLQQSRTATNSTGAPAPFPTEAFGIPIQVTDSIVDTETAA